MSTTDIRTAADLRMGFEERVKKARVKLLLDHPFFGALTMGMPLIFDDTMPTLAATNYKHIRINPTRCANLNHQQLMFLLAHEIMHCMLDHDHRRYEREPKRWNVAADIIINQALVDEKLGEFIEGGCLDRRLHATGEGMTEGVYTQLPDMTDADMTFTYQPGLSSGGDTGAGCDDGDSDDGDSDDGEGAGGDTEGKGKGKSEDHGKPYDTVEGDAATGAEQSKLQEDWKLKVIRAAEDSKAAGKFSVGMQRIVGSLLNPQVPWQEVLQRFLVKLRSDTRSFARPNRRFGSQGLYLPSSDGEALGEIVFAVDCSGSITEEDLTQYASEVTHVHEDLHPEKLHVVYFDHSVSHYDVYEPEDQVVIAAHGGGGTSFSCIFKYLAEHNIEPTACVVLTDMYCGDFGDKPSYPVLWVSTTDIEMHDPPFGELVAMHSVTDQR